MRTASLYRDRIAIRGNGRISVLRVDEIGWLEAMGSRVRVHAARGTHVVRLSLRELEQALDRDRFFRIHRSAIVNVDRIAELRHWSHGDYVVVLDDGTELRLTRGRRHALAAALGWGAPAVQRVRPSRLKRPSASAT